jgi:hypothetical protein
MTHGEFYSDAAVRDRQRKRVSAGRVTREQLDALGWKGGPGYIGVSTYGAQERAAGYERSGR